MINANSSQVSSNCLVKMVLMVAMGNHPTSPITSSNKIDEAGKSDY